MLVFVDGFGCTTFTLSASCRCAQYTEKCRLTKSIGNYLMDIIHVFVFTAPFMRSACSSSFARFLPCTSQFILHAAIISMANYSTVLFMFLCVSLCCTHYYFYIFLATARLFFCVSLALSLSFLLIYVL